MFAGGAELDRGELGDGAGKTPEQEETVYHAEMAVGLIPGQNDAL